MVTYEITFTGGYLRDNFIWWLHTSLSGGYLQVYLGATYDITLSGRYLQDYFIWWLLTSLSGCYLQGYIILLLLTRLLTLSGG